MFRIVSLTVVLTLIVALGITFFRVVAPFLLPLFVAGVAAILGQPLFLHFVRRTKGRVRLASGLATATIVLAILTPLAVGTAIASMQLYVFALDVTKPERWNEVFGKVQSGASTQSAAEWLAQKINEFRNTPLIATQPAGPTPDAADRLDASSDPALSDADGAPTGPATVGSSPATGADTEAAADVADARPAELVPPTSSSESTTEIVEAEPVDEVTRDIRRGTPVTAGKIMELARSKLQQLLTTLGDRSLGIFTGIVFSIIEAVVATLIFTVALYYFFADGTALLASTERLIPVHVEYQREMLNQFARVVRAVVSATFLAGLGQALATTLALWLCGFNHLLTLFVLCLLSAMVPLLGTWLIWGPCAIILALGGQTTSAVLLAAYGAVVVGMLDNAIRTYVLNSDTKLHPLLALISVLGGLQVMGLWGAFIGPIVASCLHALVKIFNHELAALSRSRFGDHAAAAAEALVAAAQGPPAGLGFDSAEQPPTSPHAMTAVAAAAKTTAPSTSANANVTTTKSVAAPVPSRGVKSRKKRR